MPHPVIPQIRRVCVCVCVCGGGGGGVARQYKGVKKGITVNGDSIRLLVVISFT